MVSRSEAPAGAEQRLAELGIALPPVPVPLGAYVQSVQTGNLLFLTGMLPRSGGESKYVGRLGAELDAAAGRDAARMAFLNALATVKAHLGSLDRVTRIVRLGVFIAAAPGFLEHPKVADGASELMESVFGEEKTSTRIVLGVASVPLGLPLELEVILEVAPQDRDAGKGIGLCPAFNYPEQVSRVSFLASRPRNFRGTMQLSCNNFPCEGNTMPIEKALYQAQATSTGGRDGRSRSSDGVLDIKLTTPKELGGAGGEGTNPEQLFAAGYSACFIGAMKYVAGKEKVSLPQDTSITAIVGIGTLPTGFGIEAELKISAPGVDKAVLKDIVDKAHIVCPYSNATRGNINVTLTLV